MKASKIRTMFVEAKHGEHIDAAINCAFEQNPDVEVLDIKYNRCIEGVRLMFHESALILYKYEPREEEVSK